MRRVILTDFARADIEDITAYARTHWGQSQATVLNRLIKKAIRFISEHPSTGFASRRKNTYTKVITRLPFVLVYEFNGEEVVIKQVIHTSRKR